MIRTAFLWPCGLLLAMAGPADAQTPRSPPPVDEPAPADIRPGETARISTGQIGQRQTRDQVAQDIGIAPMARISGRIQNRVQSRIRNRIDRNYDPRANAETPFTLATDQARTAGQAPPR